MSAPAALVVEGGAMRGIFAAGVLDAFLEREFNPFSLCIGVSAGANNLSAWVARMPRRSHRIFTDYSCRRQFISRWRFFRGGHLMDLDWLWESTMRDLPLDTTALNTSPTRYLVGVTQVSTGRPVYLHPHSTTVAQILKASSAMPMLYRNPVSLLGIIPEDQSDGTDICADGGLADPIPVEEAYRRGARRIVVIRSRPRSYQMTTSRATRLMARSLRNLPALRECVEQRPQRYNETLAFLRSPPDDAVITEIAPPENFETRRTTRDPAILQRDYQRGVQAGREFMNGTSGTPQ